ncbi:MAG: c-type cytochrome [Phycisphaerae bacterium]
MKSGGNVVVFILAIAAGFVYICRAIPQMKSGPVEVVTDIGETPEELIAAGKRVFNSDRAQCLTCHTIGEDPKARCPNQEDVGERAGGRQPGVSAAQYLIESVYDPNAYIVSGYPSKQMTPVNKPPIALSHDEILAVVAFLNTLGGTTDAQFIDALKEAQSPWRKGLLKPGEGQEKEQLPILAGDSRRGRELFEEQPCAQCHRVKDLGREVGPELTAIGASQTPHYILESILDASAVIVKGYRQTIVFWKDENRLPLRGTALAWIPDKERPTTLRLAILEGTAGDDEEEEEEEEGEDEAGEDAGAAPAAGQTVEKEVDLSEVAHVGDTIVGVTADGEFSSLCGQYVDGDKETGLTLAFLEGGQWVEKRIPPEQIDFINLPMSPMPANFADLLTPRDAYDLVAYLLAQKGDK